LKQIGKRYLPSEIWERRKFSFVAQGSPHLIRKKPDWVLDLLAPDSVERHSIFDAQTVSHLRDKYAAPGFDLSQTFEDDYLMIVLTTHMLMETFDLAAP
jgi:asparagine synthase (glutamine-hydrolysing)